MTDQATLKMRRNSWTGAVVLVFTLVLTSSDLHQSINNYFDWIVTALAMILLLPYSIHESLLTSRTTEQQEEQEAGKSWWAAPTQLPAALFLASICISGIYSTDITATMVGLGKLAVILLLGLPAITARARIARIAFYGLLVAVWINSAIMLGGMLAGGLTYGMVSPGRWGNILNYPGALWRLAITAWMFSAYLVIRRHSLRYVFLLIVSTLLVFLDGARTSFLLLGLGIVYLLAILGMEARRFWKTMITAQIAAVALVGIFIIVAPELSQQQNALARLSSTVSSLASGGADNADMARSSMLKVATDAIQEHPVMGTGFTSTKDETPIGPMVVHITYLQVWADLGLLGFVSYLWMVWGWIPWIPTALRRIRALPDDRERALYYNAIFLLFVFDVAGFFHPLSTEWAQWIPFLVPYSLLWHIVRFRPQIGEVYV
jgi:O-antigen ligase